MFETDGFRLNLPDNKMMLQDYVSGKQVSFFLPTTSDHLSFHCAFVCVFSFTVSMLFMTKTEISSACCATLVLLSACAFYHSAEFEL